MDFPGICEGCPLALLCATDTAYEEKHLCHCRDCNQVLMVFRDDDVLIGLVGNFPCPHPYTGSDFVCPDCEKERERKEAETLGRISYDVKK